MSRDGIDNLRISYLRKKHGDNIEEPVRIKTVGAEIMFLYPQPGINRKVKLCLNCY